MRVDRSTISSQIRLYVTHHLIYALRIIAEDRTPVTREHDKDQAPEGIVLIRYHLEQNARNEVHPLAVTSFRIIRAVSFQYVVKTIFTSIISNFKFFIAREGAAEIFRNLLCYLLIFLLDKFSYNPSLVL